jgi:hypothetical protein
MNPHPSRQADLYLDGKLLEPSQTMTWKTFEDLCTFYEDHLNSDGRAIRAVKLDGIEVNYKIPPTVSALQQVKRVEVDSWLMEELVQAALSHQITVSNQAVEQVLALSTDCLIETPQETFNDWKEILETLKELVGFTPRFFSVLPLAQVQIPEINEETLTRHIHEIQEAVDMSRRALESQDIVMFSDTLELRIVQWLRGNIRFAQKLIDGISVQNHLVKR